jgi:hypothetical protein
MKVLPVVLSVSAIFVSSVALAASTNSSNYTNLGVFAYGSRSGEFVYYKTGSARADIKVTLCKASSGCSTQALYPSTQAQTYRIDSPFRDLNISFDGKTDSPNTTVFGTLTQR